jgi:hypothetical protein
MHKPTVALTPEQQSAQRAFAAVAGLPVREPADTRPRFEARICDACRGAGRVRRRDTLSGGAVALLEYECEADGCEQTGAVLQRVTGSYEPDAAGRVQLKGEPLPDLRDARSRLLGWAQLIAGAMADADERGVGARTDLHVEAAGMRDDLVLVCAGLAELADADQHLAEQLELERQRNELLMAEISTLKLEREGHLAELREGRAAVQEATDAVLQVGAELTIARVREQLGKAS